MDKVVNFRGINEIGSDIASQEGSLAISAGMYLDVSGELKPHPHLGYLPGTSSDWLPIGYALKYVHTLPSGERYVIAEYLGSLYYCRIGTSAWHILCTGVSADCSVRHVGSLLVITSHHGMIFARNRDGAYLSINQSDIRVDLETEAAETIGCAPAYASNIDIPSWQRMMATGTINSENLKAILEGLSSGAEAVRAASSNPDVTHYGHMLAIAAIRLADGTTLCCSAPMLVSARSGMRKISVWYGYTRNVSDMSEPSAWMTVGEPSAGNEVAQLIDAFRVRARATVPQDVIDVLGDLISSIDICCTRDTFLYDAETEVDAVRYNVTTEPAETYRVEDEDGNTIRYIGGVNGERELLAPGEVAVRTFLRNTARGDTLRYSPVMLREEKLYSHLDSLQLYTAARCDRWTEMTIEPGGMRTTGWMTLRHVSADDMLLSPDMMSRDSLAGGTLYGYNGRIIAAPAARLLSRGYGIARMMPHPCFSSVPSLSVTGGGWYDKHRNHQAVLLSSSSSSRGGGWTDALRTSEEGGLWTDTAEGDVACVYATKTFVRSVDGTSVSVVTRSGVTRLPLPSVLSYPSQRAYMTEVHIAYLRGGVWLRFRRSVRLHESASGDFAYYVETSADGYPTPIQGRDVTVRLTGDGSHYPTGISSVNITARQGWLSDGVIPQHDGEAATQQEALAVVEAAAGVSQADVSVPEKGMLRQSAYAYPFVFPPEGAVRLAGDVLHMCAAVRPVSEGQFGQYPVYVFTSSGIYAMSVADDGKLSASHPVSRDVLTGGMAVSTDSSVVYVAEGGVMMLSGGRTECISPQLTDDRFDPAMLVSGSGGGIRAASAGCADIIDALAACGGIRDYVDGGASLLWDAAYRRVIIASPVRTFQWAWSCDTRSWSTMHHEGVMTAVADVYPLAAVQVGRSIMSAGARQADRSLMHDCVVVTRPMHLGTWMAPKRLTRLYVRGVYDRSTQRTAVWATSDGMSWWMMRSLRSVAHMYRAVLVHPCCTLDSALTALALSVDEVRPDRIRP